MPIGDKIYDLELNDSEYERIGWQNARYKGTKLTSAKLNIFTEGDNTFGKDPVIEQYSTTVYVFNKMNHSFSSFFGDFYPEIDEFNQNLNDKLIVGSTQFKIDRAVNFTVGDPTVFDQLEPGSNVNDPSFHFFDTLVKHDLSTFNTCSVRFFDNTNNGFVKKQYVVGYNRGEFQPAAAYFQSASGVVEGVGTKIATEVVATAGDSFFDYELSDGGRFYINPNVEEWFISQDGASGSQGVLTAGQTAITIDHNGETTSINSVEGYFFQLSKRLGSNTSKKERYYISFDEGKQGVGNLIEKDLIKAFDVHALEDSGSNIDLSNNRFNIKTIGRHNSPFTGTYDGVGKEEYVIFKEFISNNVVHLNFNKDIEAPAGTGNGGIIIPANLHPEIKEQLNIYLSNAGLGAQGGTSATFRTRGVLARSKKIQGGLQELQTATQDVKSTTDSNISFMADDDDGEDAFKNPSLDNFNFPDNFFDSDIRLKENIIFLKKSLSGIPIYKFNYIGKSETYTGTMAQDLLRLGLNKAVSKDTNGYYLVNYNLIDVDMKKV